MKFKNIFYSIFIFIASFLSFNLAKADIYIAVVGPLTGPYANFGEQMIQGAQKAVDDINASGGILGENVVLLSEDDACDPKQAIAVANRLAANNVSFVIGHFCSGSSIPAAQVYNEEQIIQITPGSTNPLLTQLDYENVFRICGRDDQQGYTAAQYIKKHFSQDRIAIIHDKQIYSKGLADETYRYLKSFGVSPFIYETITPGEKDYSALVTKLKSLKIQTLYYGGYHSELGLIKRQMKEQNVDINVISGDAINSLEYWAITGNSGEGTLFTFALDPSLDPKNKDLVNYYKSKKYNPEGYTLYTYSAFQVLQKAIKSAKSKKYNKVIKALKNQKFDTAIGHVDFDEKGDVKDPSYVMYKWSKGKYKYVK